MRMMHVTLKYCCAITKGYVVDDVCSKQPNGSRINAANACNKLAAGDGYTRTLKLAEFGT
jgi:hypothetical protein